MSFILDALRKSESERQRQGSAEFAGVPTSAESSGAPRWLWIVAALLAVNLAVLLGLLMRPEASPAESVAAPIVDSAPPTVSTPDPATPAVAESAATTTDDAGSFVEQVAVARRNAPPVEEMPEPAPPARETAVDVPVAVELPAESAGNAAGLPSFVEVLTNGTIQLPDLHLDIHVYSEVPEDRFVFINMSKQRERSRLSEGPVVEEITPHGVILEYDGTRFLLSRD